MTKTETWTSAMKTIVDHLIHFTVSLDSAIIEQRLMII